VALPPTDAAEKERMWKALRDTLSEMDDQVRKRRRVGPEVGPTSALYICVPTGTYGPTCIVWASLTPFSLQRTSRVREEEEEEEKRSKKTRK
jgi:hypothetical protein